jgi:cytochrome P450
MTVKEPIRIDLEGNDIQGEGARLRVEGPVALVELPGQVQAWAVGNYGTLQKLLADPRVSRSASLHWSAWKRNEIPEDWPLRIWASVQNMGNSYGADHRRLRGLMSYAFTARRPEEAAAFTYTADEQAVMEAATAGNVAGSPKTVRAALDNLQTESQADELMVTTIVHDTADRLRSFELLARLAGLPAPSTTR